MLSTERNDRPSGGSCVIDQADLLHDHLAFQRLVADIAARFGGVQPEDLDEAVVDSLRQLAESLHVDRAILWRRRSREPSAIATHVWVRDGDAAAADPFAIGSIPYETG